MSSFSVSALSPLDGRYAAKLTPLRGLMSEQGFMHRRVQVEITWLLALSDAGLPSFKPFSTDARRFLRDLVARFGTEDALAIKAIEQTTNHDVKAVEYWLKAQCQQDTLPANLKNELNAALEFIHFACTSEDINNTSHALQLKSAREQVLLPGLQTLIDALRDLAHRHADDTMLSRTHGQTASPTTVGKEMANVCARLQTAYQRLADVPLRAKMNGAVGNYNAHWVAHAALDWEAFARRVIETSDTAALDAPLGLGLSFQAYSTQIEPHDDMAALFDALARSNTVLIDLCRDMWGYIALGYFKQRLKAGEIGSSTMPHKVNPIDFENAEGNLGVSNALLRHLSEKLPISRWQRDLSDSTVLRNMGVALGHAALAHQSLLQGLQKLELHREALRADLDNAWEVLAEPIQTVMRLHGIQGAYEQLKEATRGQRVTREDLHALIHTLAIPEADKARLLDLTPATYIGMAASLARRI